LVGVFVALRHHRARGESLRLRPEYLRFKEEDFQYYFIQTDEPYRREEEYWLSHTGLRVSQEVAALFRYLGYRGTVTRRPGGVTLSDGKVRYVELGTDAGAFLVRCMEWREIATDAEVAELHRQWDGARPRFVGCILVAVRGFTADARRVAGERAVTLLDVRDLVRLAGGRSPRPEQSSPTAAQTF
jgi:hypothetical protein